VHWGVYDQTIQELEDKLFSNILLAQRQFNEVRPADFGKHTLSNQISHELQSFRGCTTKLPTVYSGRGHGPFAEMLDGSVKFDLIGGIGPYLLGHSHPLQIKANLEAARGCILNSTNFLPASISADVSRLLINAAGGSPLVHCWFSGSGSMANDSAMRLMWHKRAPRKKLIAFKHSFAGRSLAMQSITSGETSTESLSLHYIDFPNDEVSGQRCLEQLNTLLVNQSDEYCCFYGELIQGEAGIHAPHQKSLVQLFEKLKSCNIPIWIDEVQTFARTKQLFSFQTFGVSKFIDICTIGKAFNLSAVLYSKDFAIPHGLGGTFQGSVSSLLYAKSLLKLLSNGPFHGPSGRINSLEEKIRSAFEGLNSRFNVRGIGTMWAITIDDGDELTTMRFLSHLFEQGIIAWKAGRQEYCIRLLFPITLLDEHLEQIKSIFNGCAKHIPAVES
tara:strand:+ start:81 stop:1415 length:1335 start_codon:yes stop_codon:yes gene_type:complete